MQGQGSLCAATRSRGEAIEVEIAGQRLPVLGGDGKEGTDGKLRDEGLSGGRDFDSREACR